MFNLGEKLFYHTILAGFAGVAHRPPSAKLRLTISIRRPRLLHATDWKTVYVFSHSQISLRDKTVF